MIEIADTHAPIYLPSPLNHRHPLNRGRVSWLMSVPNTMAGTRWLDLCGQYPGTLTNMGSGSGWKAATRAGGLGHVAFDGVDDYVDIGSASALNPGAITVALWVQATSLSNAYTALVSRVTGSATAFYQLLLKSNGKLAIYLGTNITTISYDGTGANTLVAGSWYRVVFTYSTANGLIGYVNGVADGSAAANGVLPTIAANTTVGKDTNVVGRLLTGNVDDVSIWNRDLSASEVQADYALSRPGYPGVLNRISLRRVGVAAPALSISPAGIGSAEAWGTQVVSIGSNLSIVPGGIGTGEAWGTASISVTGSLSIAPPGIGSAETWGTASLSVTSGSAQTLTVPGIASAEAWGTPALSIATSQLSTLDYKILGDPLSDGSIITPTAGVPCTLDAVWGYGVGALPQVANVALVLPSGVTEDATYSAGGGHVAGAAGRRLVEMGWTPDNDAVFLNPYECAAGFWRLTFATAGTYLLTLAGSTLTVTVQSAPVVIPDPIIPATPTTPMLTRIALNPLNRQASDVWRMQWSGTYPSGGFDLLPAQLGLNGIFYGDINDTALYRFVYDPSTWKMKVYSSSGEVSGSISFDTRGLFIGVD